MAFRGDRLQVIRKASGLTQEALEQMIGAGSQTVVKWESGKNDPSAAVVARLAQVLRISADYLLDIVDTPLPNLTEGDLSEDERRFIAAVRNGVLTDALKAFTILAEQKK